MSYINKWVQYNRSMRDTNYRIQKKKKKKKKLNAFMFQSEILIILASLALWAFIVVAIEIENVATLQHLNKNSTLLFCD